MIPGSRSYRDHPERLPIGRFEGIERGKKLTDADDREAFCSAAETGRRAVRQP